ncbi:MAG: hypothetical protein J5925_04700 [Clostridia bacterium]|nr:hypothetical protein [Clostridia bacterium]
MMLDEQDLRSGLKFIVGKWQVDFIVNAFSNDLAHIPASEFKDKDGNDFSSVSFEFFEDHTVIMRQDSTGTEEHGTWEQTGYSEYHYTLNGFLNVPEGSFREAAEKLSVQDGALVFALGFLAIGMKKVADGTVTEAPDIGDIAPSESDLAMNGIVGRYTVVKAMAFVNGEFDLFTREEAEADIEKRIAAGEAEEDEKADTLRAFDSVTEFTADHKVIEWMKLPEGVSQSEIEEAVKAGEINAVKDGYFSMAEKEWKALDGKYYYDSGEERELFGEKQSSWDEIKFDEEGLMIFASGMVRLKKI